MENGIAIYDFLRGNEEYKYMFGVEEVLLHNLVITRPGIRISAAGSILDVSCVSFTKRCSSIRRISSSMPNEAIVRSLM
ncbi:hypothetical protein [Methyloceanibacter marginalis]|uniref:hypothetical protein n=1 Tax=Methyloceanibacter marginalis TaxID=1774971 RepID=UPI003CC79C80